MRLVIAALVAALCESVVGAESQRPVGPVSPADKGDRSAATYGKALEALLERDADERLWEASGEKQRRELFDSVYGVTEEVQRNVGRVPPRPPKPPGPSPKAPSKHDFEKALEGLRMVLEKSAKQDPDGQLQAKPARELQKLGATEEERASVITPRPD